MKHLKIRKIGNSAGIVLPKDVLARLNVGEGDKLFLIEAPDGSIRLSRHDPEHEKVVETAREVMKEYRDTFKELAK